MGGRSKRAFTDWGAGASEQVLAQGLAAFGVLAGYLPANQSALRDLLAERVVTARQTAAPLIWDLGAIGRPRDLQEALSSAPIDVLAVAWRATEAGVRSLEIRPVPWLDQAWTFQMLSRALVRALPYIALPNPPGRLRWNWPIRIGFLTDPNSSLLREQLYGSGSQTIENLTDPASGSGRSDILIVPPTIMAPPSPGSAAQWPDAAFVVRFADPIAPPIARVRDFATKTSGWGAAVVEVDPAERTAWFRAFVGELSHTQSLVQSLATAGGVRTLYAAPQLIRSIPLADAAAALGARMEATAALAPRPPMVRALPPPTGAALGVAPGERVGLDELGHRLLERNLVFEHESDGATHTANVARAARPALEALERRQAPDRFIRAHVHPSRGDTKTLLTHGFRAGAVHQVVVSVGPKGRDAIVADIPIELQLPPSATGHRLTVVFAEPALLRKPLVGTIELPAFGPSGGAVFRLPVKPTTRNVEARITVLHRGRVLQTALMRGPVLAPPELARAERQPADADAPRIRILVEAVLRPGLAALDDRSRFHAALILNRDGAGRKGGTAIGGKKAAFFQFDWVQEAVAAIGLTFEAAEADNAFRRPLGSKKSVEYLRQLALQGVTLYQKVGKKIETTFPRGTLERLQIVSVNPDTMLPVEIIYDLAPPTSKPKLCANWRAALETGRCRPAIFHAKDVEGHLDVVCPAGFWGISKIIERQAVDPATLVEDPTTRGVDFEVLSVPDRTRSTLRPIASVLFAASDHVNDVDPHELGRVRASLTRITKGEFGDVSKWKDWAEQVRTNEPPVLVLLSHTERFTPAGAALEIAKIGGPERRVVADITENYVNLNRKQPGPIVMLLGCTTAVPLGNFQSFVVQFASMGASLVLGTVAPVLGRHAGRTAEALVSHLKTIATATDHGITFGQALRDIRRQMLAKGILMSMSLAAYGDADWQLPAKG